MIHPILTWTIVTLGLTHAVTQSTIFSAARRWLARLHPLFVTLVYCPACTGFWAGLGVAQCIPEFDVITRAVAGFGGMVLGALWQRWGPEVDVWSVEQPNDGQKAKEAEDE